MTLSLITELDGLVVRREHPEQAATVDWLVRTGRLAPVLPGVYAAPERAPLTDVRMRAACRAYPDAVLTGAAAARCSFWPDAPLTTVDVAVGHKVAARSGYDLSRRVVPADLVVESAGLRFTSPALTAIDMASFDWAEPIDRALRSRTATLAGMHEALLATGSRTGNAARRRLLLDSRDEPWSEAERRAHRVLRAAGLRGWRSNRPVVVGGQLYFIDIAFGRSKLAIEIDGRLHELDEDVFESDRWRQNALVRAGWRVLRFTWTMIVDHPEIVVQEIRFALRNDR
ncbi:endonuclease domain-containing protein [uncultured Friedmanniella sp.]|uniref:endonuclease domain-containing protein n=1 Tax=uncultured Friedmanniella sp. TaxID=335381 RepID=UPI0035CBC17F